jgi:PLD-like domain
MLISNIAGSHLERIRTMLSGNSDQFIIVSPFLAQSPETFLLAFDFSRVKRLDLVTTFKPEDLEQLTKPGQLKAFGDHLAEMYPKLDFRVHVDNLLHGKLYFSIAGEISTLLLTSANFTSRGMTENHEWGILTDDRAVAQRAVEEVFAALEYSEVSRTQIDRACQFAEHYKRMHPQWIAQPDIHVDILSAVYSDSDKSNTNPKYFLKPIGDKDQPVTLEEMEDFSGLHQDLHFSKKKPSGVMKGDVVITTAVGAGSLLSHFRVTGSLRHVTDPEIAKDPWKARWPWYLEGRNQSPKFGASWWSHNLRRQDLLDEFRRLYPTTPVTYAGGFTLGTINLGSDKVRITKEFGEFLIQRIKEREATTPEIR